MNDFNELRELSGCICPTGTLTKRAKIICRGCGAESITPTTHEEFPRVVVSNIGDDASPPAFAIASAEAAAAMSPCRKSQRGASFYRALEVLDNGCEVVRDTHVSGYNGPPWIYDGDDPAYEMSCDGSERCRKECAKRCVHAKQRALLSLGPDLADYPSGLRMVHVKIGPNGRVVPGKGPSCIDCSKLILRRPGRPHQKAPGRLHRHRRLHPRHRLRARSGATPRALGGGRQG